MRRFAIAICAVAACSRGPAPTAKEYRVYFLGGQSNMVGYGSVAELPEAARVMPEGVMIFDGNPSLGAAPDGRGVWAALRPGHGAGFSSDGSRNKLGDRFGPELGFAAELRRREPAQPIAIIKYAQGGTSLAPIRRIETSWAPDGGTSQLHHARATIANALASRDVDGDGALDTLVPAGIAWMQGESDASATPEIANAYEGHLRATIAALRDALGSPTLPVVIGQISDSGRATDGKVWDHAAIVQRAQAAFVASDPHAALVPTDRYGYSDVAHYDTASYLDLGTQFAIAMATLRR